MHFIFQKVVLHIVSIYQTRVPALKAVYPSTHLVNRSIKQHGVSGVRLLCGAQDDVLILGNLLPWVSLGEELLTDPVSLGSSSAGASMGIACLALAPACGAHIR